MKIDFQYLKSFPAKGQFGTLVFFFPEEKISAPAGLPSSIKTELERVAHLEDFTGKSGQTTTVPIGKGSIGRLLCVGLGKVKELDRETLRRAAGSAGKILVGTRHPEAVVLLPRLANAILKKQSAEVIAEGLLLGGYTFKDFKGEETDKKEKEKSLRSITLVDVAGQSSEAAMKFGQVRGEAVCVARTLGNQPPNVMTPTRLAEEAQAIAERRGLTCRILEREELEKLGMGMFLGVAKGSRQPPKLILLEYRPKGARKTLAFVGKGITFDSGGISLKPGAAMDEMKFDMCGAAAVLGAMDAIPQFNPKVNVIGVVPACENLPDGNSVKPGDILTSYSGKHVEILNTDAEGRLILGDALAYTVKTYKPDAVVDLATLTGACVIALGHYATGAVTNNESFQEKVILAGKESGDIVWPLPNFSDYEESLKGKYAELQNIGAREGGAITAGLFLKNFIGKVPWVHLDIAGTAWGVSNVGHIPNAGATGVGVCLLADLARKWASK